MPNVVELPTPTWEDGLLLTAKEAPRRALANAIHTLTYHPDWRGVLRFNEFSNAIETTASPPWHLDEQPEGEWSDDDDSRLIAWFERAIGPSFTPGQVRSAAGLVARQHAYHPVRDWLRSLAWDGTIRLFTWLRDLLGATEQPKDYTSRVGAWWMVSAVARVMRPGCQADHLLVLEGGQGLGKSSAVRLLAAPWSSVMTSTLGDKDSYQALRGRWIIELAELAGVRRSDAERVKAFTSSCVDSYRPSYGRSVIDVPRQCVFIGSTNSATYLADATGGRRFWPVACTEVLQADLENQREQLWAEAVVRYDGGEAWWPAAQDTPIMSSEQEQRSEVDPWEEPISEWIGHPNVTECTMSQLLGEAIGKRKEEWSRSDETRVGQVMTRLGWKRKRATTPDIAGKRPRVYVQP